MRQVTDKVETFHDLAVAMRHAVNCCTVLANQAHLIKNTFAIRASLIQHLLLEVGLGSPRAVAGSRLILKAAAAAV